MVAAFFAALSHGPALAQRDLTPEQQAESDGGYTEEVLGTVAFLAQGFMAVADDEYDEQGEPVMKAIVFGLPPKVGPLEGWKD